MKVKNDHFRLLLSSCLENLLRWSSFTFIYNHRTNTNYFIYTVEPRFNEIAGDRPNLFVKSRVRYIENLDITNLRGNDQKVYYIEVIVNDWFVTQVTFLTQFNAIFVTPKCRGFRCNLFIKHGDFQCQLFSLLSRGSAFLYGAKNTTLSEQRFKNVAT